MSVDVIDTDPALPVVVVAKGELDIADESLQRVLVDLAPDSRGIVVDLLNVTFIDSSVVRALALAYRDATDTGGWLRVVYTHHMIRRVLEICGLAELLPQYTSVEAASRGVPSTARAVKTVEPVRPVRPVTS